MATTAFATAMSRANARVVEHLSSATGTLDGVVVHGLYAHDYAEVLGGVGTSRPVLVVLDTFATGLTPASLFTAEDGTVYRVRTPQPDGTGLTRLPLERQ